MQVLELMVTYDGVDVTNLAGAELLVRKAQMIEHSYSEAAQPELGEPKEAVAAAAPRRTRAAAKAAAPL
eukprot:1348803-Pyramimonas_sp.AAC.1